MIIKTNQWPEGLERENVSHVYVGKDGCRCGCLGKYSYTNKGAMDLKDGDYRKDSIPNEKEVDRVFNKMKKNASVGIEVQDDYIVDMVIGLTTYTIYLHD